MNNEQKQRAIKLITYWRNRSITTMPEEYFVSGDCMTDLLQEMIDAPEPEPVGYTNETELDYVRKYEALPVSGAFWPTSDEDACVALYTAPPANNQSEQHLEMVNAPAPSVPDGRKMVPDEPTAEMREAGHRAAWQSVPSLFDRDDVANVYRAMLAAAPAARLEDQPPPADRAIQPGARDATQSLYTIISDPRGAAGIYETIEDARQHAEITARRSTFGRAAIVTIVAEVAMVPQWEG